jgi:threonine dehydratase
MDAIDLAAVEEAARRISGLVARTPAVPATALSELCGALLVLKLETRQRTGSFKDRGAANFLLQLTPAERERGVIAMSAGNHAQAVAYQSARLGIPATIVMPEGTPFTKIRRTEAFGGRVVLAGDGLHDAETHARKLAAEHGFVLVHPYDDPRIIAGQGTVGLEFAHDAAELDAVVVPIGGGGLIAGVATAMHALQPRIEIVGVETAMYPSMERALRGAGAPAGGLTIAEGIAVKSVGALTREIVAPLLSDVILVDEAEIERAIHLLLEEEKLLAEGAGAAALAAVLAQPERFAGRRVGLIVTGANIDTGLLATVLNRVRLREGRVVRLRVRIADRPGVLAHVANVIGGSGANILDVEHQRLHGDVPSKNAELDVTVEMRSPADLAALVRLLGEAGFSTNILADSADSGTMH